jgi:hypothetical protein
MGVRVNVKPKSHAEMLPHLASQLLSFLVSLICLLQSFGLCFTLACSSFSLLFFFLPLQTTCNIQRDLRLEPSQTSILSQNCTLIGQSLRFCHSSRRIKTTTKPSPLPSNSPSMVRFFSLFIGLSSSLCRPFLFMLRYSLFIFLQMRPEVSGKK